MMAEGIDAQINGEKNGVEDGYEIANSNDTPVVVKGAPKIPSRYLSSRIPSCHDYCKYGIQHSAEAKPRSAAGKKFIASGRKTKASEEIVISVAGMKKSASGLNDSPTLKLGKPETTMKDQLPKGGIVPADKTLMSFVETNVSMDHNPIDIKKEQSGQPALPVQESSKSQTSREVEKSRSPFGSGSKNTSEGRIKEIRASPVGGNRRSVPTSSPLSSKRYVKKSSSTTSKTAKNLKEGANLKIQKNVEEVIPEPTSSDNSQEKILNVDEPTTVEKSMEPTLACDPPNLSLVSPSLGEKSSEQDSEKISECGSPASSKKSIKHATHGIHPTKSLAPYPQSSGIKDKRHTQKTTLASSSLSPPSQSASSRRIFRHGDQGNHQTKSTASFPSVSGIEVNRKAQNTKHNTSSDPSSLSRLRSSRRTFKHADNGNRLTTSLKPSPLPSGVKVKRRMQHIIHSVSSSSSLPSATESSIPAPNSFIGKQNGATFKSSKRGNQYPGENVKVGFKIRPKMSAIGGAGDKVIPARKLSFRRGKVIELQPQDNVPVPRRLKFRPARLLSDTEREKIESRKWIRRWKEADKGESNDAKTKSENVMPRVQIVERNKRRNFGRKVVDGSKIDGSASGSQQVVLRHQNLLGKEVTRRLYNNVIEETATKLAELRQSKVKALVGAFETVISLDSPGLEATPT
ncbi:uncharacterized protein LOC114721829 [Neltuma alba]|uniref:uncharacterized protein LOC114721829 n=1 Tax=Neltuma alba TaxID=207710 RepID=UPI0010A4F37E|nr:uncharacterized protein LOC114721829 [Prosopis alba]XP_028763527.1 uncharacterized protein LOC114721829 [Prosopis alba]XP_028763528.1 uncharacterized protein LOC114721829 [Prosopis alba]